jgi:hypothetical protein
VARSSLRNRVKDGVLEFVVEIFHSNRKYLQRLNKMYSISSMNTTKNEVADGELLTTKINGRDYMKTFSKIECLDN